ncbi:MAG: hypothetical protein KDI06_17300 [Calditrichaeota bacterium]|nr:hypothetical protein [Calditrichota bacterium]HQU72527.1 hypothetical protein [Calditrichia bacterium]
MRIIFLIVMLFWGCSSSQPQMQSTPNPVAAQIDLQSGFEGQEVVIRMDGEILFEGTLSGGFALHGPLKKLPVSLAPGAHQLEVQWRPTGEDGPMQSHLQDIAVETEEPLYIGISRVGKTVQIQTQNNQLKYF